MNYKIGVIGLGYVGLPLAIELSKKYSVIGFDINSTRVSELCSGVDKTLEVSNVELKQATSLKITSSQSCLDDCNFYIVTVPTPIDAHKQPVLGPLISASKMIGESVNKGDIIVFESTVYPGATQEVCVPEIERSSGFVFNKDFFVGYSPERINPGDKEHRLIDIKKVVSGSTPEVADIVNHIYSSIIVAGTYKASSIKVAEAAKVIENTQRDVNIALINELSIIFNKLEINTSEVLEAAGTKWNFLPFRPGLVGGHCIGVDPYYLTYKAQSMGYHPEMILAGRRLNDSMGQYVVSQLIKCMIKKRIHVEGSNILIMGLTFKENCPDLRNTKVIDIINELSEYNVNVDVTDPWCSVIEAKSEYGIDLVNDIKESYYDAVVLAVAHEQFKSLNIESISSFGKENFVLYDLKHVFDSKHIDISL